MSFWPGLLLICLFVCVFTNDNRVGSLKRCFLYLLLSCFECCPSNYICFSFLLNLWTLKKSWCINIALRKKKWEMMTATPFNILILCQQTRIMEVIRWHIFSFAVFILVQFTRNEQIYFSFYQVTETILKCHSIYVAKSRGKRNILALQKLLSPSDPFTATPETAKPSFHLASKQMTSNCALCNNISTSLISFGTYS